MNDSTRLSNTKLQLIIWRDAEADVNWNYRDKEVFNEDTLVYSIGWVIAKDKTRVLVAADIDRVGRSNRTLQIPLGCIVFCKTIKTPVIKL